MPKKSKNQAKPYSKSDRKSKAKSKKSKVQANPVNILKSKYYWIFLTIAVFVFAVVLGLLMQMALGKVVMMLSSILAVTGFAFYLGYKSSEGYEKRTTFIFAGASIVGFCIWATLVFFLSIIGVMFEIENFIGVDFFAITILIICLIAGAFVGDVIGKKRDAIYLFFDRFRK